MSKEKAASPVAAFFQGLFQLGVYKGSQGRVTRQATFATLAVTFALGAWRLFATLRSELPSVGANYLVCGIVLATGLWVSYRIVNFPKFADFLIAVEAEMNKVSWPSRGELVRSSLVVIFVILLLAGVLFGFDVLWAALFKAIGVLKTAARE